MEGAYAGAGRRATLSLGRGKTAAGAVYILYAVFFLTAGVTAVAGVVLAHLARGEADGGAREHLNRQIRLFWLALIAAAPVVMLSAIGHVLKWVLIGYPIVWLTAVLGFLVGAWFVLSSVFGLLRLLNGRSPKG